MPCNLLETQEAACESGIGKISSQIGLLQLIAQLSCEIADTEATNAIVDSFVTRSGISNQTQIDAVTALVQSARDHGWWEKCDLIYPFVGGSAAAHAQNLKSSSFTITWVGAVTHNANGITGDGATGYGFTNYVPSVNGVNLTLNSVHIYAYKRTHPTIIGSLYYGAGTSGLRRLGVTAGTPSSVFGGWFVNGPAILTINVTSLGGFCINRDDPLNADFYYASSVVTVSTPVGASIPNNNLTILARNSANPSVIALCDVNLAAFTIGGALTQSEFIVMNSDIQTFQTANGRQV